MMKLRYRLNLARAVVAVAAAMIAASACAGTEEDYKEAEKLYRDGDMVAAMPLYKKAADKGFAPAQASLAEIFFRTEFSQMAVAYFRGAAEQENADGEFGLGSMYGAGKGVEKDLTKAREWIAKAAEQGHPAAINAMAEAYMHNGLALDPKDANSEKAFHWVKLSAENGYMPAIAGLSQAYQTGTFGAPLDLAQAKVWEAKLKQLQGKPQGKGGH